MGGIAVNSGVDFQARVVALIYVRILAERKLRWSTVAGPDVPVAVSTEQGGAGDDVRTELRGTHIAYDGQCKRSLKNDAKFRAEMQRFGAALPGAPNDLGFLLVGQHSAKTIVPELQRDLNRLREGQSPRGKACKDALRVLRQLGAESTATRIFVCDLQVDHEFSTDAGGAIDLLSAILRDHRQDTLAWSLLVNDALRLCRDGGRRDYQSLRQLFAANGLKLKPQGDGEGGGDAGGIRPAYEPGELGISHPTLGPQLESARALIHGRYAAAARDLLRQLEPEAEDAEIDVRVVFHRLLGRALLDCEDLAGAREHLERVLILDPGNHNALINLAALAIKQARFDDAVDLAEAVIAQGRALNEAWALRIQASASPIDPAEIPQQVGDSYEVLAARAVREAIREQFEAAADLLETVVSKKPARPDLHLFLGETRYWQAIRGRPDRRPQTLRAAESSVERAIARLHDGDGPSLRERCHLARGMILVALEDPGAALVSFREAATSNPHSWLPVYWLALTELAQGTPNAALGSLHRLPEDQWTPPLLIKAGEALHRLENKIDARRCFERAIAEIQEDDAVLTVLAEVALALDELDVLTAAIEKFGEGNSWRKTLIMARVHTRNDRRGEAMASYAAAIETSPGAASDGIRLEFAHRLFLWKDLAGAAKILEACNDLSGRASELYAHVLYESKSFVRLQEVLDEVLEPDDAPLWARTMAANIAHARGDIPQAIALLRALVEELPDEAQVRLSLANALARKGDSAAATDQLRILASDPLLAGQSLIEVAGLLDAVGATAEAVPLLYRAYRASPSEAEIQQTFVRMMLHASGDMELDRREVVDNTFVEIALTSGEVVGYLITSEGPPIYPHERHPDSSVGLALMGRRVGDDVEVNESGQILPGRIKELKAHFVYTHQDIVARYQERNPGDTSIQTFAIPESATLQDFSFLFDASRDAAENEERVLRTTLERTLPLGAAAQLLRMPVSRVYDLLVADPEKGLPVDFRNTSESVATASTSAAVSMTRTALCTLQRIDALHLVDQVYTRLVAAPSLHILLEYERRELEKDVDEGKLALAQTPTGPRIVRMSPEEVRLALEAHERLISWVERVCEVTPISLRALEIKSAEKALQLIGEDSFDALALAAWGDAELYADDLGLRRLLRHECGKNGFSTFGMLVRARATNEVTDDEFDTCVGKLIGLNHGGVPATARVFVRAFVEHGFQATPVVLALCSLLRKSKSELDAACTVAVAVARGLALSSGSSEEQWRQAVFLMLESVVADRPLEGALATLKRLGEQAFLVLPLQRDQFEDALRTFFGIKIMGGKPKLWTP